MILKISRILLFLIWCVPIYSQLSIQNNTSDYLVNFESTITNVNEGGYNGTGFSLTPTVGQLDADAWATSGFSDGSKDFGIENTSGDHARGNSNGNVSSGGIYSFEVSPGNFALGIQPISSDFTPGTITLRVVNNSSSLVSAIDVEYLIYVLNNASRSNDFNFSYSIDNAQYINISSADFTSPEAIDSNPTWVSTSRIISISNLNLPPGDDLYLRWNGSDNSGSGSRDEFALDEIMISVTGNNNDYYSTIGSEICENLKTALHNLIDNHTAVSYNDAWTHFQASHDRINDNGTATIVWDLYGDNPVGPETEFTFVTDQCTTIGNPEGVCYNREHTFPVSWWGGSEMVTQFTDLHALIPTDGWINNLRSNFPYGEVANVTQTTMNGSQLGSSAISIPNYNDLVFEPIDAFKGNLARKHFYMATRYENEIGNWETESSRGDAVLDGSSYPVFEPWTLNLLINWHNIDPVDSLEIASNEAVFNVQGNRNPFVDHPEYVDLIWGNCGLISNQGDLLITAVYDGPLSGGTPKGIELYAINDIPNLSVFGLGSANNGNGSDGVEFIFPDDTITAGNCIYVSSDTTQFNNFFGFLPNYTSQSMGINGNDAIELFSNGQVIDVFGEANVDGSGEPWEYTDGWAYRINETGPDSIFTLTNWIFSGVNAFDNASNNSTASLPMPICQYIPPTSSSCLEILDDIDLGNPISSNTYNASDSIFSSGTVLMNDTVTLEAGTQVTLLPNFTAELGSDFTAKIGECSQSISSEVSTTNLVSKLEDNQASNIKSKDKNAAFGISPNPASYTTTFSIELETPSKVSISIFDINGKLVKNVKPIQILNSGSHIFEISVEELRGFYAVRLLVEDSIITKRLIVIR